MTKYYFYRTNGFNGIMATDGINMYDIVIDSTGKEPFGIDIYGENAIEELKQAYSAENVYTFAEIEAEFGNIVPFDASDFEELVLIAEKDKYWYAVMLNADDTDWGTGSFDLEEAKQMVKKYPEGYIAVIDGGYDAAGNATTDPVCVEEIHVEDDEEENWWMKKNYTVIYKDKFENEYSFKIEAMSPADASDACYYENHDEVEGYEEVRIFES